MLTSVLKFYCVMSVSMFASKDFKSIKCFVSKTLVSNRSVICTPCTLILDKNNNLLRERKSDSKYFLNQN